MTILNASGCLDALTAPEVARSLDAFVTKTVTPLVRVGNAPVRIAETDHGMLNSIGLANPGIDRFLDEHLPQLAELGVPLWVSVGGFSAADYAGLCARLGERPEIAVLELNVSCPHVAEPVQPAAAVLAASRATGLPIGGTGGVETGRHALELIACGASAVALGTVLFADPGAPERVRAGRG